MRQAPYLDFPVAEYEQRLRKVQQCMSQAEMEAVFLTNRDNVEWLSGFTTVSWRLPDKRFWLVVPQDGEPILTVDLVHEVNAAKTACMEDVRIWGKDGRSYLDHLVDMFGDLRLKHARVGMEMGHGGFAHMTLHDFVEIKRRLGNVEFIDVGDTVAKAKGVKSSREIDRIRKACEITCAGYEAGFRSIKVGSTERDVIRTMVAEFLRLGADSPLNSNNHGYLSLQSGRVMQMTPSPTDLRKIQAGDFIQVDGGAVYRGYTADFFRNAYVGEPPKKLQAYAVGCRTILEAGLAAIKPGVTSARIAQVVQEAERDLGFQDKKRNLMDSVSVEQGSMIGHGLGFTAHELPFISLGDHTLWQKDMCGALELLYGDEELGFVEWEDNFLVTEDGIEILSPMEKKLWIVEP